MLMMKLYNKKTKVSISALGDGSEIFDYSLPQPHSYKRNGKHYTLEYIINGVFNTNNGLSFLNDVLARFTLSMNVTDIETTRVRADNLKGYELCLFRGLKSIQRAKDYEKSDTGQDNVFWSIKLYTESLITTYGEGEMVAYSLIESFAFSRFEDRVKDKSTLKAKCRSIWNWYDDRYWTIPQRKGLGMTRKEGALYTAQKNADKTKAKVIGAIEALTFLQEKLTIANVSKQALVSRETAKKYLIELGYKK